MGKAIEAKNLNIYYGSFLAVEGVSMAIRPQTVDPVGVRRQIGMVFQRPNPFPTMSIYDNVIAGHRLNGKRMRRAPPTSWSSGRCAARTCGTRSRIAWRSRARGSLAASSSGCASPGRSPCSPTCC